MDHFVCPSVTVNISASYLEWKLCIEKHQKKNMFIFIIGPTFDSTVLPSEVLYAIDVLLCAVYGQLVIYLNLFSMLSG